MADSGSEQWAMKGDGTPKGTVLKANTPAAKRAGKASYNPKSETL